MPPIEIDADSLGFDNEHINVLRGHNVTETEAKSYVKDACVSVTRWDGIYENYYGKNGAAYVNKTENIIKTAYKSKDFSEEVRTFVNEAIRINKEDSNE